MDELAAICPDKIAMIWCNQAGEERRFSFRELKYFSDRTANIYKKHGITKGDVVMLILKRNYEYWFNILALHKIGAVVIPATHLLTCKDLVYRNNAADIKMVVVANDAALMARVDEAHADSPTLKLKMTVGAAADGWLGYAQELDSVPADFKRPTGGAMSCNSDTMLIYFTSGSTGLPKMVVHNYLYPLGHIITAQYWQNVTTDGLHLTVSDSGWAKSAWGKIYGQWLSETAVFVYDYDKFVPAELLAVIARYKITTFCAPPTIYRFLIKEDFASYDLSALKYCVVAGEPLNPEVFNAFLGLTGIKLMEGFGQTETTLQLANFPWMAPRPGSMGKPSPQFDVDLINQNNQSCDPGEEGEIVIKTGANPPISMFVGYHKDPALSASVWLDGVYHTGDVAWRDEDGYYWFVGRTDDVIKSSGYRIGPFEVESALMEHPAVLETAVTGVPDPDKGQIVKASIVLAKGYQPSVELKKELQKHVKKVTAPYKYPRVIEFVTELPKTISGKIKRFEIREGDCAGTR